MGQLDDARLRLVLDRDSDADAEPVDEPALVRQTEAGGFARSNRSARLG
jgi:hypothetical protein